MGLCIFLLTGTIIIFAVFFGLVHYNPWRSCLAVIMIMISFAGFDTAYVCQLNRNSYMLSAKAYCEVLHRTHKRQKTYLRQQKRLAQDYQYLDQIPAIKKKMKNSQKKRILKMRKMTNNKIKYLEANMALNPKIATFNGKLKRSFKERLLVPVKKKRSQEFVRYTRLARRPLKSFNNHSKIINKPSWLL